MAKISVIVPCYNVSDYIERCMNSLLNQTIGFDNLELILVDDASTDNTLEKLKRYEKQYPNQIILIPCQKNGRQGTARNIGLQYATSPYIGYVDSDDWIEPDMYEKMYEKITTYDCDVVYCRHIRDDGTVQDGFEKQTGKQDTCILIEDDAQRGEFLVSDVIGVGVWDKLYKRELLINNQIVFPQKLAYEDICFGAMIYLYARKIYILEERLYHYYVNWESTVLQMDRPHHMDIFEVNEMKWQEYIQRDAYSRFPLAVQYDFVKSYYLAGLKMLLLRYTNPSYETFLKIRNRTKEVAGNYKENPYLQNAFSQVYEILLDLLDNDITEKEFHQLARMVKQIAGLKEI